MNKQKEERKRRKRLDKIWSDEVKDRDGRRCVMCGQDKYLNAHHIIPREIHEMRYDVRNGISLCPKHHKYNFQISAHKNGPAFFMWLMLNRHDQLLYVVKRYYEVVKWK